MDAPFPLDPVLVGIAIAYRNTSYIADAVLPRVMIGTQQYKYWQYPIEETFIIPDTKVGRLGAPNQIETTATEVTSKTEDYGLDDPIPVADIDQAPANHNPVDKAVAQISEYVALDREKRVADLVFAAGTYASSNKVQLSGNSQWSDFTNSTPIADIMTALDACLMRPNVGIFGQATFSKLSQHPDIIKAIHGTSGDKGIARRAAVADMFELEEVLVGQSRLNTSKKGQTATLSRVWGKHAAFIYRDRNADTRNGITFGYSAQWGDRIAGQERDSKIGLRGGINVRMGESIDEKVVAALAGYFIEDAVA